MPDDISDDKEWSKNWKENVKTSLKTIYLSVNSKKKKRIKVKKKKFATLLSWMVFLSEASDIL